MLPAEGPGWLWLFRCLPAHPPQATSPSVQPPLERSGQECYFEACGAWRSGEGSPAWVIRAGVFFH